MASLTSSWISADEVALYIDGEFLYKASIQVMPCREEAYYLFISYANKEWLDIYKKLGFADTIMEDFSTFLGREVEGCFPYCINIEELKAVLTFLENLSNPTKVTTSKEPWIAVDNLINIDNLYDENKLQRKSSTIRSGNVPKGNRICGRTHKVRISVKSLGYKRIHC